MLRYKLVHLFIFIILKNVNFKKLFTIFSLNCCSLLCKDDDDDDDSSDDTMFFKKIIAKINTAYHTFFLTLFLNKTCVDLTVYDSVSMLVCVM